MAPNLLAALFGVVAGAVFLVFAVIHLRARPLLLRGRTITLAWVLAILYPLFILPMHDLLKGALLADASVGTSVLGLVFFVLLTLGVGWYFRGWVLFNVDTKALSRLIRDACRAADVRCLPEEPDENEVRFRLGEEGRELRLRREPGSRYASLLVAREHGLPWLGRFATALRQQAGGMRTGRYYSRGAIYLVIGLACLAFAVILYKPELLGLVSGSVAPPTSYYR